MGRLYDCNLYYGLRFDLLEVDSSKRSAIKYEGDHDLIRQAIEAGLDWDVRDLEGYFHYPEGTLVLFVGRKLASAGLDEPFATFDDEALAQAQADARGKLSASAFEGEPTFHMTSDHSD